MTEYDYPRNYRVMKKILNYINENVPVVGGVHHTNFIELEKMFGDEALILERMLKVKYNVADSGRNLKISHELLVTLLSMSRSRVNTNIWQRILKFFNIIRN